MPTTAPSSSPASCGYDFRERRFEKKVTVNGSTSSHSRFLYRGYLQIAEMDLVHLESVLVKSYLWDPTEPAAMRLLIIACWKETRMEGREYFCCMHDALKNVNSIFGSNQTRRARYEDAPSGGFFSAEGDMAEENTFRFSCEYADDELELVYYNYRHLNIAEQGGWNLYAFICNVSGDDVLGLEDTEIIVNLRYL